MEESQQQSTKFDAPPSPYVPSRVYLAQIYWKKPAIVVLRVLQFVFSLIAFSVMADLLHDVQGSIKSLSYTVAIGVLACAYALAQLSFSLWCVIRGATSSSGVTPLYQYATFICDQMSTYFLISAASATATLIDVSGVCGSNGSGTNLCSRSTASVTFAFLAFLAFSASSVLTGYYLVKCILKA
ncbi:hypothetical protein SELMODRAFT_437438 [Selaginella moellendorffii]|uniref:CASP-like protein UU1 n=1 Tax=Selaginella moellendorffii TaxID=88036 RepID=CSPLB_SELML|nr:CASP-like protein UU1 [Selaginella moellendorffii]D8QQW9.1 RecName: Full=CASP-like protein UU1; Short=SmCASPLUU1 [Selaginella moellendorffii]EFJ38523.1 hypothetical protein SELMODRAFT_437438 [Selaginella moellendorffii]|eukprot:XP_002960984.1 CASP-like protein UU1 [Selaginella moellendorffii]